MKIEIVEQVHHLGAVDLPADLYSVLCCIWPKAARERDRLENGGFHPDYEIARSKNLASDKDPRFQILFQRLFWLFCAQRNGDIRLFRKFVFEPGFNHVLKLSRRQSAGAYLTRQWKRDHAGRPNNHLAIEFGVLINRNRNNVARFQCLRTRAAPKPAQEYQSQDNDAHGSPEIRPRNAL